MRARVPSAGRVAGKIPAVPTDKRKRSKEAAAKGAETDVKTSVFLPAMLHRKARVRAALDDTNLRTVIIAALEAYLRDTPGE